MGGVVWGAHRVEIQERLVVLCLGRHSFDRIHVFGVSQVEVREGSHHWGTWEEEKRQEWRNHEGGDQIRLSEA